MFSSSLISSLLIYHHHHLCNVHYVCKIIMLIIYFKMIIFFPIELFDNYMQQDAHEFLNYLLNTIADLLQGNSSIIIMLYM